MIVAAITSVLGPHDLGTSWTDSAAAGRGPRCHGSFLQYGQRASGHFCESVRWVLEDAYEGARCRRGSPASARPWDGH